MIPKDLFNTMVPVEPLRARFNELAEAALEHEAHDLTDAEELVAERIAEWLGWTQDEGQADAANGVLVLLGVKGDKYGAVRPTMKAIRAIQLGWLLGLRPGDVFPSALVDPAEDVLDPEALSC